MSTASTGQLQRLGALEESQRQLRGTLALQVRSSAWLGTEMETVHNMCTAFVGQPLRPQAVDSRSCAYGAASSG